MWQDLLIKPFVSEPHYSTYYHSVAAEDYDVGPHTVEFDILGISLPTPLCINIGTIDDDNVEGFHTFTIEISSVSVLNSVAIQSPSLQSAFINDNDGMCRVVHFLRYLPSTAEVIVGFSETVFTFAEGAGPVELMLDISGLLGVLECPVNVTIEYTDGPKARKSVHRSSFKVNIVLNSSPWHGLPAWRPDLQSTYHNHQWRSDSSATGDSE